MMSVYEYYIRINKNLKMLHMNKVYRDIANHSSMAHIHVKYLSMFYFYYFCFKLSGNLYNYCL